MGLNATFTSIILVLLMVGSTIKCSQAQTNSYIRTGKLCSYDSGTVSVDSSSNKFYTALFQQPFGINPVALVIGLVSASPLNQKLKVYFAAQEAQKDPIGIVFFLGSQIEWGWLRFQYLASILNKQIFFTFSVSNNMDQCVSQGSQQYQCSASIPPQIYTLKQTTTCITFLAFVINLNFQRKLLIQVSSLIKVQDSKINIKIKTTATQVGVNFVLFPEYSQKNQNIYGISGGQVLRTFYPPYIQQYPFLYVIAGLSSLNYTFPGDGSFFFCFRDKIQNSWTGNSVFLPTKFSFVNIYTKICPGPSQLFNISTGLCDSTSTVQIATKYSLSGVNTLRLWLVFSNKVTFSSQIFNFLRVSIGDKQILYSVVTQTNTVLIIEFPIDREAGQILSTIPQNKIFDSSNLAIPSQILTTQFSEIPICSPAQKQFISTATAASLMVSHVSSSEALIAGSALGLLFLFINLIDVIQIVPLYIFLEISLPINLGSILHQLFVKQSSTIFEGYAELFKGERRLLFISSSSSTAVSANFVENNIEKMVALFISFLVFWVGARLTEQKLNNCFAKRIQKIFACKLYANCINSYLSISTRLVFTSSVIIWDIRKNIPTTPILPFHVIGLFAFLCALLLPTIHATHLRSVRNSGEVKTIESYFGASKQQTSSLFLVLSKTMFGPLVAAFIVLLPTFWALLLIGILCFFNVLAEFAVSYIVKAQKYLTIGSSIAYLLFHLSVCLFATPLFKGKSAWACGYLSISLLVLTILLRISQTLTVIITGLIKKNPKGIKPKNDVNIVSTIQTRPINSNFEDSQQISKSSFLPHLRKLKNMEIRKEKLVRRLNASLNIDYDQQTKIQQLFGK